MTNTLNQLDSFQKLQSLLGNLTDGLAVTRKVENQNESFNKSVKNIFKKKRKSIVFRMAWQYVKQDGLSLSEALKLSWSNF